MISNDAIIYFTFFHILAVDTKTYSPREEKICSRIKEEEKKQNKKTSNNGTCLLDKVDFVCVMTYAIPSLLFKWSKSKLFVCIVWKEIFIDMAQKWMESGGRLGCRVFFFFFLVSQTVSHHLRVGGQSESIKSGLRYKSYIRGYRPVLCSSKLMDDEK